MIYKFDRHKVENGIRILVDQYPKCFSANPQLRCPLKENIVADLQQDGLAMERELIIESVNWYKSHLAYQYCLQAGRKRIDLNGNEAGTVTEQEQLAAKKEIQRAKNKIAERKATHALPAFITQPTPIKTTSLNQLKKIDDAPAMGNPKPDLRIKPELMPLYEAVLAVDTAMSAPVKNSDMLAAVTAAIGVVMNEAQRVITNATPRELR